MRSAPLFYFVTLISFLALALLYKAPGPKTDDKPLPQLVLGSLDGKMQWAQDDVHGRVTLINFFASWCTPCAAELPELQALKKQHPDLRIEGIAWNDTPPALKKWLKQHGNPYDNIWVDPDGKATIGMGIRGLPETFIVDGRGMIRYRHAGAISPSLRAEELDPLLVELLAETARAP
jgi:cytochrome c biogenesis protein CcmG/thiol:disulfide interchange protein DsbE